MSNAVHTIFPSPLFSSFLSMDAELGEGLLYRGYLGTMIKFKFDKKNRKEKDHFQFLNFIVYIFCESVPLQLFKLKEKDSIPLGTYLTMESSIERRLVFKILSLDQQGRKQKPFCRLFHLFFLLSNLSQNNKFHGNVLYDFRSCL